MDSSFELSPRPTSAQPSRELRPFRRELAVLHNVVASTGRRQRRRVAFQPTTPDFDSCARGEDCTNESTTDSGGQAELTRVWARTVEAAAAEGRRCWAARARTSCRTSPSWTHLAWCCGPPAACSARVLWCLSCARRAALRRNCCTGARDHLCSANIPIACVLCSTRAWRHPLVIFLGVDKHAMQCGAFKQDRVAFKPLRR
jgi:hypothetical protein